VEQLTFDDNYQVPFGWSPDGRTIVFIEDRRPEVDLRAIHFDDNDQLLGEPEDFVDRKDWQCCAQFSADGKWAMFGSGETGSAQLFVRAVGGGATEQVSAGVRVSAGIFSPVEQKIFFNAWGSASSRTMFSVDYTIEDGRFNVEAVPQELFQLEQSVHLPDGAQLTSDGKSFIALQDVGLEHNRVEPKIIVNWVEELKAKVPLK
jgi:Tol biopolymer transport system component